MMIYLAAGYLVFGVLLAEVCIWTEKKHGLRPTVKQYLNLVLMWPLVLYIAQKRWRGE